MEGDGIAVSCADDTDFRVSGQGVLPVVADGRSLGQFLDHGEFGMEGQNGLDLKVGKKTAARRSDAELQETDANGIEDGVVLERSKG